MFPYVRPQSVPRAGFRGFGLRSLSRRQSNISVIALECWSTNLSCMCPVYISLIVFGVQYVSRRGPYHRVVPEASPRAVVRPFSYWGLAWGKINNALNLFC